MRKPLATRRAHRELLKIDGRAVEVTMRLNPRARRLIVKVHPSTGEVTVVAPSRRALDRALDFAQGEAPWIARQLARVPKPVALVAGARIPLLGREHAIVTSPDGRGAVTRDADAGTLLVGGRAEHVQRRVLDYLKREARRVLDERSRAFAARIDASVHRVAVRDTASRWGSCSTAKAISYSWRLIFAPDFVLDYVVAHEVAHLREMNHGPRFWKLVRSLVPDIEAPQAWLRKNGTALHRYGAV
ncbi:MAG: SprT family zinc-dependent metalloprotease [Rhizomicrobium sp.]